jgi:redox-sensitive bicupin YhaK (pirin superfamily)
MYLFLLDGQLEINGQEINARDAYGAVEFETLQITTKAPSRVLIIEVPMQFKN